MVAWLGPLAMLAAQAAEPVPCSATLCHADALASFFEALEARRPVHILQIGDSHTAGDMVSQGWRWHLQQRYGHGGRGVLPPGRPYLGYLTWGVTAGQSSGWRVNASFGRAYTPDAAPLGLSGFTQSARAPGETLTLTADALADGFDRLTVCAITQPGGGTVTMRLGDESEHWSLEAAAVTPECRTLDSHAWVSAASLVTEDAGLVSITSFAVFWRESGVALSNLGVSGAQLAHFGRASDAVVAAELAAYRPDLIVIAFGTNEGFSPIISPDDYEAGLREQVARIRRLAARHVPILLLGAPDAATRMPSQRATACGGGWFVPQLLSDVRERQRQVAREIGLAFWDWSAAMGGRCSSVEWHRGGKMRGDHVHFTRSGGARVGWMINDDLTRAAMGAD